MAIFIDTRGVAALHATEDTVLVIEDGGLADLIQATTTDVELDAYHAAAVAGTVGTIAGLREAMTQWRDVHRVLSA